MKQKDLDPGEFARHREPRRIRDLKLPERAPIAGKSAREADLDLLAHAPEGFLDATHFDTVRFPPPAWAAERFAAAAADGAQAYSGYRGHPHVLESVAEVVGEFLGHPVDPRHNIILTPGTQAGLFAALSARVESADRVAVVDPDYLFTARILRFLNCEIGYVPLQATDAGYAPDLKALENEFANKGARHLVFSHPNNPTGAVYSPAVVRKIAALVERYDVRVLADELYSRLIYDGVPFTHLAAESGMFERVVTLLGPSKTESLSGYRLGVMVGPGDAMAGAENVLSITSLRAPAYAQHVLLPWLRDDQSWLNGRLSEFKALRQLTLEKFRQLSWLEVAQHDGTAYAWVDVSVLDLPDNVIATEMLEQAGVLVSPGYQFGPSGSGHFRVCFARDEAEWALALDRMIAVLDGLATQKGLASKTAP